MREMTQAQAKELGFVLQRDAIGSPADWYWRRTPELVMQRERMGLCPRPEGPRFQTRREALADLAQDIGLGMITLAEKGA